MEKCLFLLLLLEMVEGAREAGKGRLANQAVRCGRLRRAALGRRTAALILSQENFGGAGVVVCVGKRWEGGGKDVLAHSLKGGKTNDQMEN